MPDTDYGPIERVLRSIGIEDIDRNDLVLLPVLAVMAVYSFGLDSFVTDNFAPTDVALNVASFGFTWATVISIGIFVVGYITNLMSDASSITSLDDVDRGELAVVLSGIGIVLGYDMFGFIQDIVTYHPVTSFLAVGAVGGAFMIVAIKGGD